LQRLLSEGGGEVRWKENSARNVVQRGQRAHRRSSSREVVVDGRHLQLPLKSKIAYYLKTYSTASLSFDAAPLLDKKSNANKCSNFFIIVNFCNYKLY